MEYNLVTNLETCYMDIPSILYYSHIPTAIIAIIIGLFVFLKDRYSLISRILLFIATSFALWSMSDLVIWINPDSKRVMFLWSWINLLEMLISVSTLYFAYLFLEKKDISFKLKLFFGLLLIAFTIFIPTKFNLTGFNYDNCESMQGPLLNYYHILEAFFSVWLLIYLIKKIKNANRGDERKKTVYLSLGVIFFLLSFSGTNVFSSITTQWEVLQYGLFGMVIFMGFLAYLIVKFKAFNIKMLAAEALVVGLIILVGSEFFFTPIENTNNVILISVTVLLATIFGIWLINSERKEFKRKEELQMMSDQLASANEQLKKLDKAKSEFISIASHQLRTPLTAIKGYVSLIIEGTYGPVDAKVKDALSKVYISNERLVQLVENLLNISRIESGRIEYKYENWQMENIVNELMDNFIFAAKKKDLYLHLDLPSHPLPMIRIDGPKVKEVISNMIDNAIKYTNKGGVTVKAEESEDGDSVRVIVSDTGIGIPKDEMPYMFAKFSRGRDTSRLQAGGTGLGMYVGKSLIEAQNGKIWAESAGQDRGSKFIVELPVHRAASETDEKKTFGG